MPIHFSSKLPLFSEGVVNRTVFGAILDASGKNIAGLQGVTVVVSAESLGGSLTQIGVAPVDGKGAYSLAYDLTTDPHIIHAAVTVGGESLSERVVTPAKNERINFQTGLTASGKAPTFTTLQARLTSTLASSSTTLQALDASGIARASIAAGVKPNDTVLARSAAISEQLSNSPRALHFALGAGGLSGAVADVLKHPRADREGALARAVAADVLAPIDAASSQTALSSLDSLMIQSALQGSTTVASPGHALTLAGVSDPTLRASVLQTWVSHQGTVAAFWASLGLSAETKSKLQYALQLDKLTRSNASLMSHLFQGHTSLASLVSLDLPAWIQLVAAHAAPSFLAEAGYTPSDYAEAMFSEVEDAYPTAMLQARATWFGSSSAIQSFLTGNPGYLLEGESLRLFLAANPNALSAAGSQADQDLVMNELPKLERLYRLAPRGLRFEAMRDLRAAGIVSSTQIQLMGRRRFAELVPTLSAHADAIFTRATALGAVALAMQVRHGAKSTHPGISVLPQLNEGLPTAVESSPVWQQMFGGRTSCSCKECQSALGPSAYLADLLFWLWSRQGPGDFTSALRARRADVQRLELTCKNANTTLPAIDLVIERLEELLSPLGESASSHQTSLHEEELAARPEHVNASAYARLAGENEYPIYYPFDQPYVFSLDRLRTFMAALGIDRGVAMASLDPNGIVAALSNPEVAAEVLGLSRGAWTALTQTAATAEEHWGLARDLIRPVPTWLVENATANATAVEGVAATVLTDNAAGHVGQGLIEAGAAGTDTSGLVSLQGSVRIRRAAGATNLVEVAVGVNGDFSGRAFRVSVGSGTVESLGLTASMALNGDWFDASFSLTIQSGASVALRVRPAAAGSTTGSVTIAAPRLVVHRSIASVVAVPAFLELAGDRSTEEPLPYDELENLLRAQYVQDAGSGRLRIRFANVVCDVAGATLESPDPVEPYLVRMAKLLRLSRALGWSIADTDRAILAFRVSSGGGLQESDLSESLLVALATSVWIGRTLRRAPNTLIDWWAPLDTRRWGQRLADSVFIGGHDRVYVPDSANAGGPEAEPSPFQRRAHWYQPGDTFEVADSGAELAQVGTLGPEVIDRVAHLAGVASVDIQVLARTLSSSGTPSLSLGNLSELVRLSELASSLGLTSEQVLDWRDWLGSEATPLAVFSSPASTLRFVLEVGRSTTARLPNALVQSILRPDGVDFEALGLPREGVALLALGEIVRSHRAADDPARFDVGTLREGNLISATATWSGAATSGEVDPAGGVQAVRLAGTSASISAESDVDGIGIWCSLWVRKDPEASGVCTIELGYSSVGLGVVSLDLATGATQTALSDVSVVDAGDWWFIAFAHSGGVGAPFLAVSPATESVVVYGPRVALAKSASSSPLYRYATRDRAVARQVASLLNVDETLAARLLTTLVLPSSESALDSVLRDAEVVSAAREADPTATADPTTVEALLPDLGAPRAWVLLATVSWVCRVFDFQAEDVPYLVGSAANTARGFNIEDVVYAPHSSGRYSAWAAARELARLQTVSADRRILDLFIEWLAPSPPTAREVADALAGRTGWDAECVFDWVASTTTLPLLAHPATFARMAAVFELSRSTGQQVSRIAAWIEPRWPSGREFDYAAIADQAEGAIRGAWGEQRWLSDMPAVRERLRERQRRALVSRVVGDVAVGSIRSASALGEHLLMDVQIGGCARTSRVKDAIRTVQAFVQRTLLGAEGDLRLTTTDAREWVWRKSYRLWEANRKVFLYPENWLRPELRTDKTPLFARLETDLGSGDLRTELVESAYRSYLTSLTEISRLETLAVHREQRSDGTVVSHVFARSRTTPAQYFHREKAEEGAWGAWQELAKVEGEHLMPVVHHGRLLLFWLRIADTAKEPDTHPVPTADSDARPPTRYFVVRLSWSEYRDGRWTAPVVATPHLGVSERGELSGGTLADFVSAGVGPGETADAGRRTYPSRVLYGRVRTAQDGRDLLVDVFRTINGSGALPLQAFRIHGADGSVSVESIGNTSGSLRPQGFDHRQFLLLANRLVDYPAGDADLQAALDLPLRHASTSSAVFAEVLGPAAIGRAVQLSIVAPDPLNFDSTSPFVFEDDVGAYWVTYDPRPFFQDVGFGGSYFPGMDLDLRLPPPIAPNTDVIRTIEYARHSAFKSELSLGSSKLVTEGVIREVVGQGGKVVALNSEATDLSTKRIGLNSTFEVLDSTGSSLIEVRAGKTWDVDDVVQVALSYRLPALTASPTLFSSGFHFLVRPAAKWKFTTLFHPHVMAMREALNRLGVFGLIDPSGSEEALFGQDPQPDSTIADRYAVPGVSQVPADDLDFSAHGAYAQYNWELFFHAPFLIASRLHEAGKFEDALKWIRLIFDPYRPAQAEQGASEARRSYWRFRPFREEFADGTSVPRNIQALLGLFSYGADDETTEQARELLRQIRDWRQNPFDPHVIARDRTITYMTAVVMKFLEIVIDWGDELFARDTLESIGEATELYLLAGRVLGPKPETVSARSPSATTFDALLVQFQEGVGVAELVEENVQLPVWDVLIDDQDEASSLATMLYFCVPANPDLKEKYWDRVADRLFKIRNCMDIQGRRRELALFEPPIDPDLLVRAAASGVDLQSVIADIVMGRVPHRRYLAMAELAAGLAAGAQGLGQALLSAFEKRDADLLNSLRSTHERRLQEDAIRARRDQIADLQYQRQSLDENRASAAARLSHYRNRPRTNAKEAAQLGKTLNAKALSDIAAGFAGAATMLGLIPDLDTGAAGAGGTPRVGFTTGGKALATVANAYARGLELGAASLEREGRMLLAESAYDRRKEDWDLQATLAERDLKAIDARILSSDLQLAMARRALESAELRLAQIDEVTDFLERRFAREDLYDWTASQLSSLHYQSYQLAYEFAKKAEKAWQYELGRSDSFIQFGYWDSRRKGLLAADRLLHDLRRMQVAYSEISTRRIEVDQTFSMREIDPVALMKLKRTGSADLSLPESFFDLYYPGHYGRRIRAVRLSIPAAVPPNTNLPAHVELIRHRARKSADSSSGLVEGAYGNAPVTMMATSTGQRDGGLFEFSFNGPKLLPFEGAGAVSSWRVSLPKFVRPFDYDHIQDVQIHVAYDAEYSASLRAQVDSPSLVTGLRAGRSRAISLRSEHGGTLRRIVAARGAGAPITVSFDVKDALPVYLRNVVTSGDFKVAISGTVVGPEFKITLDGIDLTEWSEWSAAGDVAHASSTQAITIDGTHTLAVTDWTHMGDPGPDFDVTIVVDLSP